MYTKLPIGYFKFIIEIFFAYEREDIYFDIKFAEDLI